MEMHFGWSVEMVPSKGNTDRHNTRINETSTKDEHGIELDISICLMLFTNLSFNMESF